MTKFRRKLLSALVSGNRRRYRALNPKPSGPHRRYVARLKNATERFDGFLFEGRAELEIAIEPS